MTIPHSKANQANLSQLQLAWKQLSTLNKLSMTFLCQPILYFQVFCIGLLIQGFFLMVLSVYWKLYSSSWPISSCVVISWNTHWMLLFWIASIGATLPVCNEVGKWMSEEFDEKFSTRFYMQFGSAHRPVCDQNDIILFLILLVAVKLSLKTW